MKKYLIILLLPLLVFTIGCEDEETDTSLAIALSAGCSNLYTNNRVTCTVTKVGGDYNSGSFYVNAGESVTLDVPGGGNYNIIASGVSDSFFGSNGNWSETQSVPEGTKGTVTLTCN